MTVGRPEQDGRAARVQIVSKPLWKIRLVRRLPRQLMLAASLAGLIASARFAIAPPRTTPVAPMATIQPVDPAAAGFAVLFVRRYLTWSAAEPVAGGQALVGFTGGAIEAGAGFSPPSHGEQHVLWAEAVQAREPAPGLHVYTVAAQTDAAGLLYVAVGVQRTTAGLRLSGYPAFVGPPASIAPAPARPLREVNEGALETVVSRGLRNYLAGAEGELASDLASGARVSPPALRLTLDAIQSLQWSPDGRAVVAVVQAQDTRGARYTLDYELEVLRAQGRWEIVAVEMDPNT